MESIFGFLFWLNNVACTLTLTVFLLFNRKPAKKETPEEDLIERQQFKEHWIILAFWLLGTIVVGSAEINVLWVILFIIAGAYIASSSKSSGAAFQLAKSRTQNPTRNSEDWHTGESARHDEGVSLGEVSGMGHVRDWSHHMGSCNLELSWFGRVDNRDCRWLDYDVAWNRVDSETSLCLGVAVCPTPHLHLSVCLFETTVIRGGVCCLLVFRPSHLLLPEAMEGVLT